jgi:glycosyltransferase involved in cell wall biosynthesis
MRVLHCITGLTGDGAQRVLLRLAESMSALGIQSSVVSLGAPTDLIPMFNKAGVPVFSLDIEPNVWGMMVGIRQLKKFVLEVQPDVIQGWMYHANLIATLSRMTDKCSVPVLWNIRRGLDDYDERRLKTRCVIRSNAVLSSRARVIIYCSSESRTQHEQFGFRSGSGVVIGNGFDTERFRPRAELRAEFRKRYGIADDEVIIGNIGRYDLAKGHAYLVEAFSRLLILKPRARLVLVGRGVDSSNEEMLSMLHAHGCRERVLLLGEQTNIETIHPAFDLYCSSSISEGFPNALSEAMACGVVCVTTDTGASKRLVTGIGRVVPPRSAHLLAEALLAAIDDGAEIRHVAAERGRQRILSSFTMGSVARQYGELYESVVSL